MALSPRNLAKPSLDKFKRLLVIYGGSGAGKTTLAAGAQDVVGLGPVYHIDFDGSTSALEDREEILGESARTLAQAQGILNAFANKDADTLKYGTVVADGVSSFLKRMFENMTLAQNKTATFAEWNRLSAITTQVLNKLRDIPQFTVVTLWSQLVVPNKPGTQQKDDDKESSVIVPDIRKGALNEFLGNADDVFYLMHTEDKTRYLYTDEVKTREGLTITAKTRNPKVAEAMKSEIGGKLVPIIKDPSMADLFKRYQAAGVAKVKA